MTKEAFLEELNRLTGALTEQERARLKDYYGEMIDDRVEEGVPEEEAVAALGSPADIAREFAPAAVPAERTGGSETVDALESLRVHVRNADVKIAREPLENGAAAQLRFSDPTRFEWRAEGGALVIEEREAEGERFSLRWLKRMILDSDLRLTVALSCGLSGALEVTSAGGDARLENITLGDGATLSTASGDIRLSSVACGVAFEMADGKLRLVNARPAELRVHSASGDVEANDVRVNGPAKLETASGDIELRNLDCGELTLVTASGDIEVDRGRATDASIRAASGDVRLDEVECDPELTVETASGDIELKRCIARQTRLKSVSGDVELGLEPLPCGYDIATNTVSGECRFDDACAGGGSDGEKPVIRIQTVSGDIEARAV